MESDQPSSPSIIATWIPVVLRTYAAKGYDADALLAEAGIDKRLTTNPDARIRISDYNRLWQLATDRTQDCSIGLRVIPFLRPTTFHALGVTLTASSTIREALERLCRYYRIISDEVKVRILSAENLTALCFSPYSGRPLPVDASVDAFMAVSMYYARMLADETLMPARVEFMHPPPSAIKSFETVFGVPVTFSAPDNRLYFNNSDILHPLPTANAEIAFRNDEIVAEYLARYKNSQIEHAVRWHIIDLLSAGEPSLEKTAKSLGMSPRSLNRRLSETQTTYREILEDVRRELSARYLSQDRLSVIEVAFRLGYADSSNFTRAFKRWFNLSPSGYRAGEMSAEMQKNTRS